MSHCAGERGHLEEACHDQAEQVRAGVRQRARVAGQRYTEARTGYEQHVQLTADELDRLPRVLNLRPLWLAWLDYREAVRKGETPTLDQDRTGYGFYRPQQSGGLPAQAIAAARG